MGIVYLIIEKGDSMHIMQKNVSTFEKILNRTPTFQLLKLNIF